MAVAHRASVIIPVRDRAALLRETLAAIGEQSVKDFEVIVVDDASTDDSRRVAESAGATVIANEGVGAVAARTTGVRAATGEVLAFVDSDCVPSPTWLERGIAAIDAGADVVQGRTLPRGPVRPGERSVSVPEPDGLFATCNVFYRRKAFDSAGGFDLDAASRFGFRHGEALRGLGFGEDTLLGWRVARRGTFVFEPEATVFHAVLPFDPGDAIKRAWIAGGFPALVREAPELNSMMLVWGVGLGDLWRGALWAALLARTVGRRRTSTVLAVAWALKRLAPMVSREPSWKRWPAVGAATLCADAVTAVALALGSARARRLVI